MAATDLHSTASPVVTTGEEGLSSSGEGRRYVCDACGESFAGAPGGAGLFIWTRGDEVRYEEPPLCESCAIRVSTTAMLGWALDDEDEE